MDASDRSSSPRSRQLQGPRPPRLAVSKDSHKIRKPPVAPQPRHHLQQQPPLAQYQQHHGHGHHQPQQQQQQQRAPVIIYDASPKVIHTKPGDFMALVQRLTGPGSAAAGPAPPQFDAAAAAAAGPSASASAALLPPEFQPREFLLSPTAALSPAARLAAIERSVRPLPHGPPPYAVAPDEYYSSAASAPGPFMDVDGLAAALGLTPGRPGILSPVPSALPPAAASGQFSPLPFDPSCFSWLGELSPFLPSAGARAAGMEPPFAPSPGSQLLLATPTMPSPATVSVLEFFSNFPDM